MDGRSGAIHHVISFVQRKRKKEKSSCCFITNVYGQMN